MAKVEMYTTQVCPYCVRAKDLLKRKGVTEIAEYLVDSDDVRRDEMMERASGRRSVPQIFIDDRHIGGFDDLHALDQKGDLDGLLNA